MQDTATDVETSRRDGLGARRWPRILLIAAAYYVAARAGLTLQLGHTHATPIWPPSGIAFAAVLWAGEGVWPGIFLGAWSANVAGFLYEHALAWPWALLVAGLIALGNTGEALIGRRLLERLRPSPRLFSKATDSLKFAAAAVVMCLVAASVGPCALAAAGIVPGRAFEAVALTWWLGDLGGILALTPFLLSLTPAPGDWPRSRRAETAACLLLLGAVCWAAFGGWVLGGRAPLQFLVLPFLVWAGLRLGVPGSSASVLVLSVAAAWATVEGRGPFALPDPNDALLLMEAFVAMASLTALALAGARAELQDADSSLRRAQDLLEDRVRERTRELADSEAALRAKTAELVRSNADLETFASVASHDLQEPLRKVIAFGDRLREQAGALPEGARDSLNRMQNAAERMRRLIEGLLRYSRVSTKVRDFQPVDLGEVVRGVLCDLELRLSPGAGRAEVGQLPTVEADPFQMQELFSNLIGNALKFVRPGEAPQVSVEARALEDGFSEVTVRDHGVGFEEQYADRIFTPFTRLHGRSEFEGSGMGLSICRKIVQRHGGRIWARSAPGWGTQVHVVLPLARSAAPVAGSAAKMVT